MLLGTYGYIVSFKMRPLCMVLKKWTFDNSYFLNDRSIRLLIACFSKFVFMQEDVI